MQPSFNATNYLVGVFNAHSRGTCKAPRLIEVSTLLFEMFKAEIKSNIRIAKADPLNADLEHLVAPEPTLYFKSALLRVDPNLDGTDVRVSM